MWKMRVLCFYLSLIVISPMFLPILIVTKYLNISDRNFYAMCKFYANMFIYANKYICGIDFTIKGLENIPTEKTLILANHQSFWDNLFMPAIFPRQSWIVKRELLDVPLFGPGLRMTNPIAIDRNNMFSVKEIIKQGVEKFKAGLWVVLFPEGTRVHPEQTRKLKPSGVKLAQTAGVPILMVAHNSGLFWPTRGFWLKKPGTIEVVISEPISSEECISSDTRDLNTKVEKWLNENKNNMI